MVHFVVESSSILACIWCCIVEFAPSLLLLLFECRSFFLENLVLSSAGFLRLRACLSVLLALLPTALRLEIESRNCHQSGWLPELAVLLAAIEECLWLSVCHAAQHFAARIRNFFLILDPHHSNDVAIGEDAQATRSNPWCR